MLYRTLLLACTLLAGCASAPTSPPAEAPRHQLLADALFAPPSQRIDAAEVFAPSDEMREYLRKDIASQLRQKGAQRGLLEALYSKGELKIEYDSTLTRTAAQAFAARSGNCLSLVIMTASLAKQLGMPVYYQSVAVDEVWSRSGDLYFGSGHVNVTLERKTGGFETGWDPSRRMTIDFLPPEQLGRRRVTPISESTVVGMFMNNRAGESIADGRLDDAYWWAREAITQAPAFMPAYNTLGVVYLRRGHLAQAERVLAFALERDARSAPLLTNMTRVLQAQGRSDEAQAMQRRLAQIEPHPPFHFFDQGVAAMRAGDYRGAKVLFERELSRAGDYHEFHFWLALAHLRLGEHEQSRKHLALALEHSTRRSDKDLYAAKLDRMRTHSAQ